MSPEDFKWAVGAGIIIFALCLWIVILRYQVRVYSGYANDLAQRVRNLESEAEAMQTIIQIHNERKP